MYFTVSIFFSLSFIVLIRFSLYMYIIKTVKTVITTLGENKPSVPQSFKVEKNKQLAGYGWSWIIREFNIWWEYDKR